MWYRCKNWSLISRVVSIDCGVFETRVLMGYECRREEAKETGEKFMMKSFVICTPG
jgi:hypothetical protein